MVVHKKSIELANHYLNYHFSFGAEGGISTNKLHARGSFSLTGLTTYKYLLEGQVQIVSDYQEGEKKV